MNEAEEHPELSGYVANEGGSSRRRRRLVMMRVVVTLCVVALVLPGIMTTISFSSATAQRNCAVWVRYSAPGAGGASARFEVFGPGFIGWECYATDTFGGDRHVASFGLIPSAATLPSRTVNVLGA